MTTKYVYPEVVGQIQQGLSKRELFAAMAMQGFAANHILCTPEVADSDTVAAWGVQFADALIAALDKYPAE